VSCLNNAIVAAHQMFSRTDVEPLPSSHYRVHQRGKEQRNIVSASRIRGSGMGSELIPPFLYFWANRKYILSTCVLDAVPFCCKGVQLTGVCAQSISQTH
ncbi:hypothetical protein, partial [Enterobacter hormaechei]|uniref:hypothetical protein n=1 Tax=Enterobacter hormaechei TaxID=158836 RepID=UPI001CC28DF6